MKRTFKQLAQLWAQPGNRFAVYDDYASRRFHHVSFETTQALDQGRADFVTVKKRQRHNYQNAVISEMP